METPIKTNIIWDWKSHTLCLAVGAVARCFCSWFPKLLKRWIYFEVVLVAERSGATKLSKGATTLCLNQSLFPKSWVARRWAADLVMIHPGKEIEILAKNYYCVHPLILAIEKRSEREILCLVYPWSLENSDKDKLLTLEIFWLLFWMKKIKGHPKSHILYEAAFKRTYRFAFG